MELKVFILDDEYIILDGLCSFPWEMYGCRIVGKAMDGEEGIALIDEYQPDIVLSDIKMPAKNGIEVSRYVRSKYPDTQVILLTGYDNFSYAQQAITIGVSEYLLKPVNFREMHEVIERICKTIRQKKIEKQNYSELRKKYLKSIPEIRAKLISDLLNGRLKDKNALQKKMNQINLEIEKYLVLYGKLTEEVQMDIEPGLVDFIVCNVCKEYLEKICYQVYVETDPLGYTFLITYRNMVNDRDAVERCKEYCKEIIESIQKILKSSMIFGISNISRDPYNMVLAYNQSITACETNIGMEENGGIIEFQDVAQWEKNIWEITVGEKRTLFWAMNQGYVETAKEVLGRIFDGFRDMEVMRYSSMELLISCFQYVASDDYNIQAGEDKKGLLPEKLEKLYFCRSKKELMCVLNDTITILLMRNQEVKLDKKQQLAKQIMEYICNNYRLDISLDQLSVMFKISKTYINNLLKKFYSKSFLDILHDCRLEKAKNLILENKYKVSEIAEMVGYHDDSYFIRVFKKKYGITPNTYGKY